VLALRSTGPQRACGSGWCHQRWLLCGSYVPPLQAQIVARDAEEVNNMCVFLFSDQICGSRKKWKYASAEHA